MMQYLGLPPRSGPAGPVRLGVAVWNLNHVRKDALAKAEEKALAKAEEGSAGPEPPATSKPGTEPKTKRKGKAKPERLDLDRLWTSLASLRNVLPGAEQLRQLDGQIDWLTAQMDIVKARLEVAAERDKVAKLAGAAEDRKKAAARQQKLVTLDERTSGLRTEMERLGKTDRGEVHDAADIGLLATELTRLKAMVDGPEAQGGGGDPASQVVVTQPVVPTVVPPVVPAEAPSLTLPEVAPVTQPVGPPAVTPEALDKESLRTAKTQIQEARRELRKFKRAIEHVASLDEETVALHAQALAYVEKALAGGAGGLGDGPLLQERITQFGLVRALNRTLERADRLRTYLRGSRVRLPVKLATRRFARSTVGDAEMLMGSAATVRAVRTLADVGETISLLKKWIIVNLTRFLLAKNKAVNVVLFNEMNQGMANVQQALAGDADIGVSTGPQMGALGEVTEGTMKAKQYEYYPGFYGTKDKEGLPGLTTKGTFYVNTKGRFVVPPEAPTGTYEIPWNKALDQFRGIVVHRLEQGGQEVWNGIIHTTPAGTNLHRDEIWKQIRYPLESLTQLSHELGIPLVVAGDFYIPPEAIVNEPDDDQKAAILGDETEKWPLEVLKYKLTVMARNLWYWADRQRETRERSGPSTQGQDEPSFVPGTWASYWKDTAGPAVEKLLKENRGTNVQVAKVLDKLAPGLRERIGAPGSQALKAFDKEISWTRPRVAGDMRESDIFRRQHVVQSLLMTMEPALEAIGLTIVHGTAPTNPKATGKRDNKDQLADMIMVNKFIKTFHSGALPFDVERPTAFDDELLTSYRTFTQVSDHSMPFALLSTEPDDPEVYKRFRVHPGASEAAAWQNVIALRTLRARLHENNPTTSALTVPPEGSVGETSDPESYMLIDDEVVSLLEQQFDEQNPIEPGTVRAAVVHVLESLPALGFDPSAMGSKAMPPKHEASAKPPDPSGTTTAAEPMDVDKAEDAIAWELIALYKDLKQSESTSPHPDPERRAARTVILRDVGGWGRLRGINYANDDRSWSEPDIGHPGVASTTYPHLLVDEPQEKPAEPPSAQVIPPVVVTPEPVAPPLPVVADDITGWTVTTSVVGEHYFGDAVDVFFREEPLAATADLNLGDALERIVQGNAAALGKITSRRVLIQRLAGYLAAWYADLKNL
jgi:hypothetical protein